MHKNTIIKFIIPMLIFLLSSMTFAQQKGFDSEKLVGDPDLAPYPFTPGDAIFISNLPDTTSFMNGIFAIDDRGFAEFPMVGKVNVSKMTRDELIEFLKTRLRDQLNYPNLYVKPVVRISLLGGFRRPGLYYVDINSSLWEAVRLAGGTLLEEGIYDLRWERDGDERSDEVVKFFESGTSLKKMGFQSGDQVWTPSPDRETFWDTVRDVMPILTFATTIFVVYSTYQRDTILLNRY